MSSFGRVILFVVLVSLSSGCCMTRSCLTSGYGVHGGCGSECGDAGCGGTCSGARGCCLGLGCIGKLFSIADYGCGGCGETYYHDWISDPPCGDPCDCDGHYTGVPLSGDCGGCGSCGDCGGGACGSTCGADCGSCGDCGPSCGAPGTSCDSGCGSLPCGYYTGRLLYRTWTGLGQVLRGVRYGFLPSCGSCNAFSFADRCVSCSTDRYFGGAGMSSSCNSCGTDGMQSEPMMMTASPPSFPHVVESTPPVSVPNGRPPHPVVARRRGHLRP